MKQILPLLTLMLLFACNKDPEVIKGPDPLPATLEEQLRGNWGVDYAHYSYDIQFDLGLPIPIVIAASNQAQNPQGGLEVFSSMGTLDYNLRFSFNLEIPMFPGGGLPLQVNMSGFGDYEILSNGDLLVRETNRNRRFKVLSHGPFHLTLSTVQTLNAPVLGEFDVDIIVHYAYEEEI
ncbi:MAG: hypothetical protein JJU02_06165 [Cryomorphaceae bacterium]|nr:hypothetical protein [Cryomorphaceae bacterium]